MLIEVREVAPSQERQSDVDNYTNNVYCDMCYSDQQQQNGMMTEHNTRFSYLSGHKMQHNSQ